MKNTLEIKHTLKHNISYSKKFSRQLRLLSLDNASVKELLRNLAASNPFINYEPSFEDHEFYLSNKLSLKEHLYHELHSSNCNYKDKICNYIIESLDNNGFFLESIDDSINFLKVSRTDFLNNLHIIQDLEPLGVASTSFKDCLLRQLKYKGFIKAYELLDTYEKEIIEKDFLSIQYNMRINEEELQKLLSDIRSCNPYPCSEYSNENIEYISPLFTIVKDDDELHIELSSYDNVSINKIDAKLDKNMKRYLNEAHFYIDELNRRNTSILAVANELLNIQKDFFLYNKPLKPLTLKDISLKTGFNISTISRLTSDNYYSYNNDCYKLKDLFVSKTKKGSSKDEIIYYIKEILIQNDKLSDQKIVNELQNYGLHASRRTINKYRKQIK